MTLLTLLTSTDLIDLSSYVDRWDFAKFRSSFSLIIFTDFSSPFYTHPSLTQQVDILFVSAWSSSSPFICIAFSPWRSDACAVLLLSCVRLFVTPWTVACTSVHEILQAGILEWGTMPSSRRSSKPQGRTQVYCIAGRFFTVWATQEAQEHWSG